MGWAFECLEPSVSLEFEPTKGGLIIQCERCEKYVFKLILLIFYFSGCDTY